MFHFIVSILWPLTIIYSACKNCSIIDKWDGLWLNIYACYSSETALNVGLRKIWEWKGMRKLMVRKFVHIIKTLHWISTAVELVLYLLKSSVPIALQTALWESNYVEKSRKLLGLWWIMGRSVQSGTLVPEDCRAACSGKPVEAQDLSRRRNTLLLRGRLYKSASDTNYRITSSVIDPMPCGRSQTKELSSLNRGKKSLNKSNNL
jgi:hypothetical protein